MRDFAESLKLAVLASFVGILPALILNAIAPAFGPMAWALYIVYAVILLYSITAKFDTLPEILVAIFFILGIQGLVGSFINIPSLQWASIATLSGFLTTLVIAALAVNIVDRFLD